MQPPCQRKQVHLWIEASRGLPWASAGISCCLVCTLKRPFPPFCCLFFHSFVSLVAQGHCWLHTTAAENTQKRKTEKNMSTHSTWCVHISGKCITYYICDTLTVLSLWNMVEKQDLRPVMQSGRWDKWALKYKWQLHESSICTKQSVAEDLETENTFFPSFLQISDSVDTVKWSSSNLVCVSQSRKTSYILIAFP